MPGPHIRVPKYGVIAARPPHVPAVCCRVAMLFADIWLGLVCGQLEFKRIGTYTQPNMKQIIEQQFDDAIMLRGYMTCWLNSNWFWEGDCFV